VIGEEPARRAAIRCCFKLRGLFWSFVRFDASTFFHDPAQKFTALLIQLVEVECGLSQGVFELLDAFLKTGNPRITVKSPHVVPVLSRGHGVKRRNGESDLRFWFSIDGYAKFGRMQEGRGVANAGFAFASERLRGSASMVPYGTRRAGLSRLCPLL